MMKKSILFVNPDYHCSFFYRDEFRRLGWRADIYKSPLYPEKLLYSDDVITTWYQGKNKIIILMYLIPLLVFFLFRYKYFLIYGSPMLLSFGYPPLFKFIKGFATPELVLAKLLRKKLIYLPSGCNEVILKTDFSKLDNGNVCNNCGYADGACDDRKNQASLNIRKTYGDFHISVDALCSSHLNFTPIKYKAMDLDLWKPDLHIPEKFLLTPTKNLRILHSFYNKKREHSSKNIKGSPYIATAIEKLKKEGYPVEYYYPTDVPLKYMRYYQAQADITVEQLIYGWWGSTGVETMALGKPVVCYLRPSWKESFLKHFPEYNSLPIVEANTTNIYDVLKELVEDEELRIQKGKESRVFAERHFDVKKNTVELEKNFLGL